MQGLAQNNLKINKIKENIENLFTILNELCSKI